MSVNRNAVGELVARAGCGAVIVAVAVLVLSIIMSGCRTKYVATEYRCVDTLRITDTVYRERVVDRFIVQADSCSTEETNTARMTITDFDSVGRVARVTDIDYTSASSRKSGGKVNAVTQTREVEQASHSEASGNVAEYRQTVERVPYVPWWVKAAGIAMAIAAVILLLKYIHGKI